MTKRLKSSDAPSFDCLPAVLSQFTAPMLGLHFQLFVAVSVKWLNVHRVGLSLRVALACLYRWRTTTCRSLYTQNLKLTVNWRWVLQIKALSALPYFILLPFLRGGGCLQAPSSAGTFFYWTVRRSVWHTCPHGWMWDLSGSGNDIISEVVLEAVAIMDETAGFVLILLSLVGDRVSMCSPPGLHVWVPPCPGCIRTALTASGDAASPMLTVALWILLQLHSLDQAVAIFISTISTDVELGSLDCS